MNVANRYFNILIFNAFYVCNTYTVYVNIIN
nr:MAG TPA: hypothetical protein [Caudoviricetes sp.]